MGASTAESPGCFREDRVPGTCATAAEDHSTPVCSARTSISPAASACTRWRTRPAILFAPTTARCSEWSTVATVPDPNRRPRRSPRAKAAPRGTRSGSGRPERGTRRCRVDRARFASLTARVAAYRVRRFLARRHSQVVRQGIANPSSPVRIRVPPPSSRRASKSPDRTARHFQSPSRSMRQDDSRHMQHIAVA